MGEPYYADDRPHEVTATPLPYGGGWIYHCNACGYIDTTPPPIPCVPGLNETWARPAAAARRLAQDTLFGAVEPEETSA